MRKVIFFVLVAVLVISANVNKLRAQSYTNGIGLRGGFESGVTFKHFIDESKALEFIGFSRWKGWGIIGMMELHANAFGVDGLNWFYGGGVHVGQFSYWGNNHDHGHNHLDEHIHGNELAIGVDPIVGIEYHIGSIPITISVDIKPVVNIISSMYIQSGGGISIRYAW